ncbi:MAG: NYN domain-containing protein [Candidatus Gracilibacteria bacterium]|nr:NYN domain-containing protein [Candidatus Gracilibacteria bacterium]
MENKKLNNVAFIDGQNLHLGTTNENWKIDFRKFRIYLKDKFKVNEVYLFLGFLDEDQDKMYRNLQKSGYILEFREHNSNMKGKKKGNVDVDIVFEIMRRLKDEKDFDNIVLVTGDGDYIKLVKYLIENQILEKILFPNNKYSSLYKSFKDKYGMNLSQDRVKDLIKYE